MDHKTLRAIEEWDYLSLSQNFERNIWEACGGAPIAAAMIAAERLGATEATVLKYANSGDITGDKTRVVGYGAVAFSKAPAGAASARAEFTLNDKEKGTAQPGAPQCRDRREGTQALRLYRGRDRAPSRRSAAHS